jgi:OPT family oligopeptide transporter
VSDKERTEVSTGQTELQFEGNEAAETRISLSQSSQDREQAIDPIDQAQLDWYHNVYQGDHVPQLTFRAVLMGGLLGMLMSISNLYTMLKVGWCFGVAITAGVMSFVIWNAIRLVFRRVTPMTILESTCMQSTASAAGYSTGGTVATAFGAFLLITGHHVGWQILLPWTFITASLGVFLAIPMKQQMINRERLPFPGGIAAAETLRSLYSKSKESLQQAYCLLSAMAVGTSVGLLRAGGSLFKGIFHFDMPIKLPDLVSFPFTIKGQSLPGLGYEPSVLLMGAGMIVGMRASFSMIVGSCILYFVVAPMLVQSGELESADKLMKWAVWTGSAMMVTSGLMAVALQWKMIARTFTGFKKAAKSVNQTGESIDTSDTSHIEVPAKWFLLGVIPLAIIMAGIQYVAFSIAIPLGLLSVVLSFFLALVACRSTGETDITPMGAMGKITQLIFAALSPANATTNLMTASVTANIAASSSDLLTDLKSGYLLGANPRKQFLAQFIGVFFGTATIVPAWYLLIPDAKTLDSYHPPSTYLYRAVAEALSHGISYIPVSARWGLLIGGVLGIVITVLEHFFPKHRNWIPSSMGLGLSWVMTFSNCFAFFLGALIATVWSKINSRNAEVFTIPVASGAIAGESLSCALLAMSDAIGPLLKSVIH